MPRRKDSLVGESAILVRAVVGGRDVPSEPLNSREELGSSGAPAHSIKGVVSRAPAASGQDFREVVSEAEQITVPVVKGERRIRQSSKRGDSLKDVDREGGGAPSSDNDTCPARFCTESAIEVRHRRRAEYRSAWS